ncbi:ABC transporter substrate-binding protein [Rhizobium sp. NRK18]|uniref:ABC transporter substrate-binding protein n=1 Tax=Rhizobium sp. NRK18 TaxID=2964667 RepID=UPI0021C48535|nr:ABC transporter substrate-binding protein [Rhizobium sp. NRK18]MCQ2005042.1 ABC transporter substrate-binding protein [Rhizobium sp. NRK18]
MTLIRILPAAALAAFAFLAPHFASARTVTIEDAAGRTVEIDAPAKRVLLGEARQVSVVAAIKGAQTFDTIVGWRDDLISKDLDTYNSYLEKFPQIADLPRFGYVGDGTFNLEAAIALKPDVMTLNLESEKAAEESGLEEKLAAAGIKLVYIDFRADPDANMERSIRALGDIFGNEERAEKLIDFRREQLAVVADRLKQHPDLKEPSVYLERAPGIYGAFGCCRTFGPLNFGKMIALAGGHNVGSDYFKTIFGDLNPEQLIAANPDIVMVTGANWTGSSDINRFVSLGPGADLAKARVRLEGLMEDQPFASLDAVKKGHVYAIWHQFYGTPYDFVAVQQFAKWFHPDLFADIDPDATFRKLHETFLPVDYKPGYAVALNEGTNG